MSQGDGSTQKPDTDTAATDQQSQQPAVQQPQKDPWNKFTYNPRSRLGLEIDLRLEEEKQVIEDPGVQGP